MYCTQILKFCYVFIFFKIANLSATKVTIEIFWCCMVDKIQVSTNSHYIVILPCVSEIESPHLITLSSLFMHVTQIVVVGNCIYFSDEARCQIIIEVFCICYAVSCIFCYA